MLFFWYYCYRDRSFLWHVMIALLWKEMFYIPSILCNTPIWQKIECLCSLLEYKEWQISYNLEWFPTSLVKADLSKFSGNTTAIPLISSDFHTKYRRASWEDGRCIETTAKFCTMMSQCPKLSHVHHILCGNNSIALHALCALCCASHPVWMEGKTLLTWIHYLLLWNESIQSRNASEE